MDIWATTTPATSQKHLIGSVIVLLISVFFVSACGMVDLDIHERNFFASSKKQKNIGTITFHYGEDEEYEMRVRRVRGGYALQAPISESKSGSYTRFVASRTKEQRYFVGIEGYIPF